MSTTAHKSSAKRAAHGPEPASAALDSPSNRSAAPWCLKTAPASQSEADDNYSLVVARLNDRWRVIESKCGLQWILQRRDAGIGAQWRGSAFCRSRDGLLANIRERCGDLTEAGLRTVEQLPERMPS
ncbi:MAG TPA: hypothetical protein VMN43_11500 [Aestuariivirgaceae bacterium]|nr:hypothetical protein [Aestuariivirgaceae bacterium]